MGGKVGAFVSHCVPWLYFAQCYEITERVIVEPWSSPLGYISYYCKNHGYLAYCWILISRMVSIS